MVEGIGGIGGVEPSKQTTSREDESKPQGPYGNWPSFGELYELFLAAYGKEEGPKQFGEFIGKIQAPLTHAIEDLAQVAQDVATKAKLNKLLDEQKPPS